MTIKSLQSTSLTNNIFYRSMLAGNDPFGILLPLIYSLRTLGGGSADTGTSVALDSLNNVYAAGITGSAGAGNSDLYLAKYNQTGKVEWQRTLGGAGAEVGLSVVVDSSDNVYVLGDTVVGGDQNFLLAKYNSSGSIQWQRILDGADYQDYALAIDSSDNLYIGGTTSSSGAGFVDVLLVKYNSSGTVQWQRTLGGASYDYGFRVDVDSSGNIYVAGMTYANSKFSLLFAKYNSAGTIQFQKLLTDTGSSEVYGLAVDSSNNVYVSGFTSNTTQDLLLVKYNSSGTVQWQRILVAVPSFAIRSKGVAVDTAGNVYVMGHGGSALYLIAKYNSSGTIQWQRTLSNAYTGQFDGSIAIDSSGNICVLGSTSSTGEGSRDLLLAVLPSDGSLTGTYVLDGVDMVYAASSLTATSTSGSASNGSLTSSTASLTAATSTLTDASASLITHAVEIV